MYEIPNLMRSGALDSASLPPELTIIPAGVAAKILGMSAEGLAQMRYRGTGPDYVKRGRRVFYRPADIAAYLEANTVKANQGAV
ncbi:helix-turn-helix domain-containing protein [Nocardia sp. NPDC004568]|uniref:helix-turn-helix domain-containing protein n=1 Tax=Nocardia sp. NPDC004568 TaxID=3154551 RepID=UPI0033AEFA66